MVCPWLPPRLWIHQALFIQALVVISVAILRLWCRCANTVPPGPLKCVGFRVVGGVPRNGRFRGLEIWEVDLADLRDERVIKDAATAADGDILDRKSVV